MKKEQHYGLSASGIGLTIKSRCLRHYFVLSGVRILLEMWVFVTCCYSCFPQFERFSIAPPPHPAIQIKSLLAVNIKSNTYIHTYTRARATKKCSLKLQSWGAAC